jgi:Flp pilus assembly protein TadD
VGGPENAHTEPVDKSDLATRYELTGDERAFEEAQPQYERALADHADDPRLLLEYGYLLQSHGRNEIRRAAELYERAIALDPDDDKLRYQLISARAALDEPAHAIDEYEERIAAEPGDLRWHRLLSTAYLMAGRHVEAGRVVEAGLRLAPEERTLIANRGEVKAAAGDPEGALADWRLALELDREDIGPRYSSAFLLEREGRTAEAADAWRSIIAWCEARGLTLETEWPKRELERLHRILTSG